MNELISVLLVKYVHEIASNDERLLMKTTNEMYVITH